MRLADLSDELVKRYGLPASGGAVVLSVEPGSVAAEAGLHAGDLITRVDKQDVHSATEARDLLSRADLKAGVRLYVSNRNGSQFLFVQRN
jgi:S1-C subfamily serine protease